MSRSKLVCGPEVCLGMLSLPAPCKGGFADSLRGHRGDCDGAFIGEGRWGRRRCNGRRGWRDMGAAQWAAAARLSTRTPGRPMEGPAESSCSSWGSCPRRRGPRTPPPPLKPRSLRAGQVSESGFRKRPRPPTSVAFSRLLKASSSTDRSGACVTAVPSVCTGSHPHESAGSPQLRRDFVGESVLNAWPAKDRYETPKSAASSGNLPGRRKGSRDRTRPPACQVLKLPNFQDRKRSLLGAPSPPHVT